MRLLLLGILAGVAACAGSAREDAACARGESHSCTCADGELGRASCNQSESGFEPCDCSAADAGLPEQSGAGASGAAANELSRAGTGGAAAAADGGARAGQAGAAGSARAAGAGGAAAAGSGGGGAPAPELITEPEDAASDLFDPTRVRSYNILIAPADLAMIDQHPSAEQWVPAQLEFEGTTYGPFKLRYKGSDGSFKAPCTRGGYDDPKAGKCSIKLGFDEVDPNLRFHGLKKLNFHAVNNDASLLRDRLGYSLFRDSQVAAPRAMHAKVLINGALEGLYVAVEQVDGRFARARFGEGGEGNVYKQVWVSNKSEQDFVAALETNTDMPNVSGMLDFQTAVHTSDAATQKLIDRAYMLRYLAVDRVIVNDDGALHFYCDPRSAPTYAVGNGNYYWYQAAQSERFWLIPWDLDLAFDATPWVTIHPQWSESAACTCVAPSTGYAAQMPPACDALVKHFVAWHADYEREVDNFIAGPFSDARIRAKLDAWTKQLQPFVMETADLHGASSAVEWTEAVDALRAKIDAQRMHRGYAY